jgi:dipeptidyl aminopeptidase/acylaminoacyl peptidase
VPKARPNRKLQPKSAPTERESVQAPPGRPITAEDLFNLHLVSDPQLSPDGLRVAYVVTRLDREADDYRAAIWLVGVDGGEPFQLTSGAARDTTPRWSPDGHAIAFVSNRPPTYPPSEAALPKRSATKSASAKTPAGETAIKPKTQIWVIPVDGGEPRQLTRQRHGASAPAWSPDGRTIAFLSAAEPDDDPDRRWTIAPPEPVADEKIITTLRYRFDGRGYFAGRYNHVWTIPAAGGEPRQLTGGEVDDDQIAWSPDSSRIAFVANRTPEREHNRVSAIYVVPASGGDIRPLVETDATFHAPAWSPDGTTVAFFGHLEGIAGGKNHNLWTMPVAGGDPTNHTATWDRSFGDYGMSDVLVAADHRPTWSKDGQTILALASDQGATNLYRVSLTRGGVTPVTTGARRVTAFTTAREGRIAFTAGDDHHPFEVGTTSATGKRERPLTNHNAGFCHDVALVPLEEIRFPSQAGDHEIQGWILKPPGFEAERGIKYPLIVQIHGGPHAMYGHAMFHEMQLMAARGYVVLFTNPRGSAGYGEEFTTCTRARWGEADMPDILGALDAILARGYIDERRVGVTGGSYGGYLTNWLIGHCDRFQAAVTQRCVANFYSMYGTSDIGFDFGEYEFGGNPWANSEHLLRYSPISYVEQITAPLLIIHNEGDLRCPIEQAEQLFVALERLGKEVAFVRIPEEDHNLSRTGKPSRRLARLHHLIGWFDQHL